MTLGPALLADLILLLHAAIVAFAVAGQGLFMLGGVLGWRWVRGFWLRVAHLGLIVYVAGQAWLGRYCPLTLWEVRLRLAAGQSPYGGESFVKYWVGELLFHDLPGWVFLIGYSAFAGLVLFTWWWIPPRRGK